MIMQMDIPQTWKKVRVSDIGTIITGNTPPKINKSNFGNHVPFVKPPELLNDIIQDVSDHLSKEGAAKARVVLPNSVLVSCIGNLGKTGINRFPVAFNQQINAIVPFNGINPLFIFYQAQSFFFRKQLEEFSSATTISIINKGNFQQLFLNLAPWNEQNRIVAKIEELFSEIDNGLENLFKAQKLLKAYRQSLLKNAFEGKLTAEWRDANKIEATDSKIYLQFILEKCETKNHLKEVKNVSTNLNALPKLPSGWIWTNLDSLIYISQNGLSKRQGSNGIQTDVLRLADIKNKCIKTNNLRQIVCSESEIKKYQLFTSDILCIRVNGSTELVGQLISYQEKKKTQLFCDHFIRLRPLNSEISTYLCMYGLTDFARRFMEKNMVSTAGQNTISQFSLLQMPIPFPGKSEQNQIISILQTNLSIVDKLEENLFACIDQMKALRQSVLKKAFSGELVSQDANDEPANVLLERIKAEKEIPKPQKKKSKQLQKAAV
jgi:type I restriction enzyme, S subunit